MNAIIQIIQHTPIWVFPLIAGGAWLGGILFGRCARLGLWYWQANSEIAAQA